MISCRILSLLDAGHGGKDPGAVYNGRQEKDDALALTLAVGEILQERGVDVLYTRTTDIYESPYQKAMEANAAGVDFFVSIHRNSYPTDNAVSGVESLIYDKSGIKLEMAENINDQLESIGFVNLGVKERPGLVVLRRTKMPAVLVKPDSSFQIPTTSSLTKTSMISLWRSQKASWRRWEKAEVRTPPVIPFRSVLTGIPLMQTGS